MLNIPEEIKELLHRDSCYKNIRIHFPDGERTDICNDLIVMDSVKFTESLCSQNALKFGLCESPVFECEVVGVGNIKGAKIEVYCEIECDPSVTGATFKPDLQKYVYSIPYGTFVVEESKRQADMQHRKIQAYRMDINSFTDISWFEKYYKVFVQYPHPDAYTPSIFLFLLGCLELNTENVDMFDETSLASQTVEKAISTQYVGRNYGVQRCLLKVYAQYEGWEFDNLQYSKNDVDNLFRLYYDTEGIANEQEALEQRLYNAHIYQYGTTQKVSIGYIPETRLEYEDLEYSVSAVQDLCRDFANKCPFTFYGYRNDKGMYVYVLKSFRIEVTTLPEQTPYEVYYSDSTGNVLNSCALKKYSLKSDLAFLKNDRFSFPLYKALRYPYFGPNNWPPNYASLDSFNVENYLVPRFELCGQFGRLNRYGSMDFINIKRQFDLTPSGTLYPGNGVYPQNVTGGRLLPQDYQSCWYEDEYTTPYGAVYCKYKNTSNQDVEYTYYLTGYNSDSDPDTYKVYSLESNKVISDNKWTSTAIQGICSQIANHISGVSYMPVDFVGRGLPQVEAGDTFEILTESNDSITTIVLNRTISGEQVLTDSYKSV